MEHCEFKTGLLYLLRPCLHLKKKCLVSFKTLILVKEKLTVELLFVGVLTLPLPLCLTDVSTSELRWDCLCIL